MKSPREIAQSSERQLEQLAWLAEDDPKGALAELARLAESEIYPFAFSAVAAGWAKVDPVAASKWVEGIESEDFGVSALFGLIPVWGSVDPQMALNWALKVDKRTLRDVALVELASVWGSYDSVEVFKKYRSLPEESAVLDGLHAITSDWALRDPKSAIRYLSSLELEQDRDRFLEMGLVSLTNQNPLMAWRESGRIANVKLQEHVKCMALEALAEENPEAAINLAETIDRSDDMALAIARGWSFEDAEGAKQWVETIDVENLRNKAFRVIREED
ncbi:MAG: hypothetical protein AB8D78_08610 [Akkermansiaceae bacterium]